jgi:hypothetical protein
MERERERQIAAAEARKALDIYSRRACPADDGTERGISIEPFRDGAA